MVDESRGVLTADEINTLLAPAALEGIATVTARHDPVSGCLHWRPAAALIEYGLARWLCIRSVALTEAGRRHAGQLVLADPHRNTDAMSALLEHDLPGTTWQITQLRGQTCWLTLIEAEKTRWELAITAPHGHPTVGLHALTGGRSAPVLTEATHHHSWPLFTSTLADLLESVRAGRLDHAARH